MFKNVNTEKTSWLHHWKYEVLTKVIPSDIKKDETINRVEKKNLQKREYFLGLHIFRDNEEYDFIWVRKELHIMIQ